MEFKCKKKVSCVEMEERERSPTWIYKDRRAIMERKLKKKSKRPGSDNPG